MAENLWDFDLSQLASVEYMCASGLGPIHQHKLVNFSKDWTEPLVSPVSPPLSIATSTSPPRFLSPSRVHFIGLLPLMTPAQVATR